MLIDNGSHAVDIARYLLGPIAQVQVQEGKNVQRLPVEDSVQFFFRTATEVMGTVHLSWSIPKEQDTYVNVYGTEGLLSIGWHVDMTETARRIRVPTLVLHPERDAVVPVEEGRLLAGLIPDCRFVQLDSENHMPLADEPMWPQLLAEIRAFLAQGTAERATLPLGELTPRERDVLECIARGLDNAEIAVALELSEKTVRNHITRVFDKIGVEHRYQAIVRARDAGLGLGASR